MKLLKTIALGFAFVATFTFSGCKQDASAENENTGDAIASSDALTAIDNINIPADKPVVIDFNATWCGPCRYFAPVFEETAAKYAHKAFFTSVDVDKYPKLAQQYNVSSIPNITIVFPNGSTKRTVGAMDAAEFEAFLRSAGL